MKKKGNNMKKAIAIIVLIIIIILLIEFNTDFSFLSIFGGDNQANDKEESDQNNDDDEDVILSEVLLKYEELEGEKSLYLGGEKLNMDNWQDELKQKLQSMENLKVVNVENMKKIPRSWLDYFNELETELGITIQELRP